MLASIVVTGEKWRLPSAVSVFAISFGPCSELTQDYLDLPIAITVSELDIPVPKLPMRANP